MDAIEELLTRGVDTIYPSKDVLEKVLRTGKKLKLYQGFDPTGTQLHVGHMVGLRKLRQFQDLGHKVIFLIGDGTGQAGDPSGKLTARDRFHTQEELRENARDYVMQAAKIVKFDGDNPVEVLFNGDWLNKLTLAEILTLLGRFSVQQLLERDMFQNRIKEDRSINLREFVYPLLQGYDSVAMNVDLEVGGTDQTFNMLTGRQLVKEILGKEKFVLTLPLLADASGRKIGKTEGNVIALTAQPADFYGMIMNLPDTVIIPCFEIITDLPLETVTHIRQSIKAGKNPMQFKKQLALTLTRMLNNEGDARKAQEHFEQAFQKRQTPADISIISVTLPQGATITDLVVNAQMAPSRSEAKRLITSRAVELNGSVISDPQALVTNINDSVLKVGKHKIAKIKSTDES